MKEFSTEIIEIDGKEYKLFMNRKGLIAWEKTAKVSSLDEVETDLMNFEEVEITKETNPYEIAEEDYAKLENKLKEKEEVFVKFYWIALYENHKLEIDDARDLFYKAKEEYGLDQLTRLATQIIEKINTSQNGDNLKKLKALQPKK